MKSQGRAERTGKSECGSIQNGDDSMPGLSMKTEMKWLTLFS